MKPIRSILTPIFAGQPGQILKNAILLSSSLRAELHVLAATVKVKSRPQLFVHQWAGDLLSEFLATVKNHDIDLVLLRLESAMDGISAAPQLLEKNILEQCPAPILLIPSHRSLERLPIESLLVAISGERRDNEALALAIHLANTAQIPLDILHVAPAIGACSCGALPCETVKDEFYHEYPKLVEQLATQASPFSSAKDRRCIRTFFQCSGEVTDEVLKIMRANPAAMLVLEWKGVLEKGHAETLRKILSQSASPVLLAKAHRQHDAFLKVGERFGT